MSREVAWHASELDAVDRRVVESVSPLGQVLDDPICDSRIP